MKVVILCGGMGTRLKEETEFKPKPMIMIGDRPILWHIMKAYALCGYSEFILCLGYRGEMIKEYFYHYEILANDFQITLGKKNAISVFHSHGEEDWNIILADTGHRALKGARLKRIERYVDGDQFMVTYGDGLSDLDLPRLMEFHLSHGRIATLTGVRPLSRFGEIQIEGDTVKNFAEKPQSSEGLINGGFFVFRKEIFDYLQDREDCDLEYGVLETLAGEGQLMVYRHEGFWACMDTYRDMEYLNRLWAGGHAPWKIW
ncbi:MAG: glucose-1-phosphate cytidylyltransferase [Deltaproteobacteria bacterium]|nr:glucose-1-phosphate cytidylyltransferase [Deltaproteobacteria bacterium]